MPMLFSEHQAALFEGKQAEEYKAKKAEAEKHKDDAGKKRFHDRQLTKDSLNAAHKSGRGVYSGEDSEGNRYVRRQTGKSMTPKNPNYGIRHPIKTAQGNKKDAEIQKKARDFGYEKTGKDNYRSKFVSKDSGNKYSADYADDAINRHIRRHPTKEEAGIFAEMVDTDEPTQYGDQMTRDDLVPDDEICNGIQHQYNGIEKTGNGIDDNGAPVDESYGIFEPMMEGEQKERYLANKHGKKADELKAERERKERRYGDYFAGRVGGDAREHPDFMKYALSDKYKGNKEKTRKAKEYSTNAASNYLDNRIDDKQTGKSRITSGYDDDAQDAAERKYRRTHKNESALPFV